MPKPQANKPTQPSRKVKPSRGAESKLTAKASARKNGKPRARRTLETKASPRAAVRKKKAAPVPPQYGTATPHLIVSPCSDALAFYAKAFGAKTLMQMPGPNGLIMHAEMKIGDSIVMCSDEMELPGSPRKTPKNAGATTGGVMLYVKNVDAFFERAVAAGATAVMSPADQFWGDRYAQIEDPYGHVWALATHLRDMTAKEMKQAVAQLGSAQA